MPRVYTLIHAKGWQKVETKEGFAKGWAQRDSNPRPPACKAGALNQLSYAPERTTKLRAFGILSNRKGKVPDVRIF